MLRTDAPDLMELFARLFDTPDHSGPGYDGRASTLVAPMAELSAPPVRLTDLLESDSTLLDGFLQDYETRHTSGLHREFTELSKLIRENDSNVFLGGFREKQARKFVYPVV